MTEHQSHWRYYMQSEQDDDAMEYGRYETDATCMKHWRVVHVVSGITFLVHEEKLKMAKVPICCRIEIAEIRSMCYNSL